MFLPAVDQLLAVSLPGEILRAPIVRVIDDDTVLVEIEAHPLNPSKAHTYKRGDVVAARREQTELGEAWVAVDDRLLRMMTTPQAPVEADHIVFPTGTLEGSQKEHYDRLLEKSFREVSKPARAPRGSAAKPKTRPPAKAKRKGMR